ncbi:hypothetical Protein YC6258_03324 [Gynuella sunshinyii YC6258]|uniref:Uncharacterized protein n=1 Tax=Gynuella sunshinyii YC6258 TaxID=1445510 RepID=A0A0C5V7G6_9GAMM|nr:hypothetical Protein YC6258_03324 [Gynuella sunshinyii YC6258]
MKPLFEVIAFSMTVLPRVLESGYEVLVVTGICLIMTSE